MGPVRGLTLAALGTLPAGPALAEVCDKAGPLYANPAHAAVALLTGLALWRGGRRLPILAALAALLVGALGVWGRVSEEDALRGLTDSAIQEGCLLPLWAEAALMLALAALALFRLGRHPA